MSAPTVTVGHLGGWEKVHMVACGPNGAACNPFGLRLTDVRPGTMADVTCRSCRRSGYGQPAVERYEEWQGLVSVPRADLLRLREQLDKLLGGAS